jgi:hypothetical protein
MGGFKVVSSQRTYSCKHREHISATSHAQFIFVVSQGASLVSPPGAGTH